MSILISLIFKIKKPLDTFIGFVKSLIFKSFIASLICLLREFSLIQSNLPPILEVAEILYLEQQNQNLYYLLHPYLLYLLSNHLNLKLQKKFQITNKILKIYYFL